MNDSSWASVYVHGTGDLGHLITGVIAPAMRKLTAEETVSRWFFLRYWEGGPHVRVRAATMPGGEAAVMTALREALADWPMTPATLSAEEYRRVAVYLARAESRDDFEQELLPPGTVRAVPYLPEHDVYGEGETLEAAERHFVESSALALEVLESAPTAGILRGLALSVNLMTLADHEPDLGKLSAAFAEAGNQGFQDTVGPARVSPDVMAQMNESYLRAREQVQAEIARAWRIAGVVEKADPLARWIVSIRALREALEAAGDKFDISPAGSPHAWYLSRLDPARRSVASVLLRCTHLFDNRIGVTTPDEIHIGYLVARALAEHGSAGNGRVR
ncbi:hypothetical protein Rhe02_34320 [Rhizocola hellebori]|uniref:Thiopeptide-type bacteriocin biosynthesis domain-containing protein n=1 Tax=Rhizocola hellebori TaxID=1392758 RepID=A0A8J3VGF7_9ACTN|nr:lantibiotic dehydratase C-terminal domain-containing protein [Rhizocola hellebori]GIH05365.1 hypothetical protein Rhe02_34320 [Rhizocola hellebori]